MTENELKAAYRRQDENRRRDDLKALLALPAGRRLVMHAVTISGIYRSADALDHGALAYAAGRRDIGLEILSIATHSDPAGVSLAMSEREAELAERARALSSARNNHKD